MSIKGVSQEPPLFVPAPGVIAILPPPNWILPWPHPVLTGPRSGLVGQNHMDLSIWRYRVHPNIQKL